MFEYGETVEILTKRNNLTLGRVVFWNKKFNVVVVNTPKRPLVVRLEQVHRTSSSIDVEVPPVEQVAQLFKESTAFVKTSPLPLSASRRNKIQIDLCVGWTQKLLTQKVC